MGARLLHIGLLITVLFSSTSVMLNKHFCSNELISQTLVTLPGTCHDEESAEVTCPMHPAEEKDDCCSNESQLLKTELNHDLHQFQFKSFTTTGWAVVSLFLSHLAPKVEEVVTSFPLSKDWQPPSPTAVSLPRIQQFLC